jgi:hypothetical protein
MYNVKNLCKYIFGFAHKKIYIISIPYSSKINSIIFIKKHTLLFLNVEKCDTEEALTPKPIDLPKKCKGEIPIWNPKQQQQNTTKGH